MLTERAKREPACRGGSGRGEALTRLTGLLTLLFMSATRPLTRSLEERRGRSAARRGPQAPSTGHEPPTSRKETKTPVGDWTSNETLRVRGRRGCSSVRGWDDVASGIRPPRARVGTRLSGTQAQ